MPRPDRLRVLLVWPGGLFAGGANFGVPQILSIASAIRRRTDAHVDVVDLDIERALGPVDLGRIARGTDGAGYDLVGIACYSSYEYLKVMAIAERVRALLPRAWLVTGGYHASARSGDFTRPGTPFDYVVVGDGEGPMARLAEALVAGRRPLGTVLGPESVADPGDADPYDWSLLSRYRPVARRVASQAELYLSRGCPYDCAFCMERAKRDVSWRPLEPGRAVEEMHRLDAFLDLSRWTLFVADALFGMKKAWRREFLEGLARRPVRARKVWLLIRLDLLEREDMELMARANVAPGFGLESGDPEQLKRIRKAGKLEGFLDQMMQVASWAHELSVPFGANIIVGHPGETEASLRESARFMRRLFLEDPRGTMGFLSVDPFRLYPGSPIDEERPEWEAKTGMRVHRYPWWEDGDQDFLAEWVDPSSSLDFATTLRLRYELFGPIVREVKERFAYQGNARDYFARAVDEQVDLFSERQRLRTLGMWHMWRELVEEPGYERGQALSRDEELAAAGRVERARTLDRRRIVASPRVSAALLAVPRERFVRPEDVGASADDRPLALDDAGLSTISAMHAYAATFDALRLSEGDAVVDLGSGTGYGAAVAAHVVGPRGRVLTVEVDPELSAAARANLAHLPQVEVVCADAHEAGAWRGARKVAVGFALREVPASWIEALGEDGVLVAPVRTDESGRGQTLLRVTKRAGRADVEELGAVRYVDDRTEARREEPPQEPPSP